MVWGRKAAGLSVVVWVGAPCAGHVLSVPRCPGVFAGEGDVQKPDYLPT